MEKGSDKTGRRQRPDVYNPLTGNRVFHANLKDGQVPEEERTAEPPVSEGPGQPFFPKGKKRPAGRT